MDLSSIELKLIERQYKIVAEFQEDIVLMFDNCRLYNGPDSGLYCIRYITIVGISIIGEGVYLLSCIFLRIND